MASGSHGCVLGDGARFGGYVGMNREPRTETKKVAAPTARSHRWLRSFHVHELVLFVLNPPFP